MSRLCTVRGSLEDECWPRCEGAEDGDRGTTEAEAPTPEELTDPPLDLACSAHMGLENTR